VLRRAFNTKKSKGYYFELNKQIGERERSWKELLKFFDAEGGNFNGMNYATTKQTRPVQGEGLKRDEKGQGMPQPDQEFGEGDEE